MTAGWMWFVAALCFRPSALMIEIRLFGFGARVEASSATQASRFLVGISLARMSRNGLFVADDAEIERPVAAEVFLYGMHANGLGVGAEAELGAARHAVLTDKNDQVGAHQRIVRHRGGESVIVGEMTARRTRGDYGELVFSPQRFSVDPKLYVGRRLARQR